jgi:hypothetical protein
MPDANRREVLRAAAGAATSAGLGSSALGATPAKGTSKSSEERTRASSWRDPIGRHESVRKVPLHKEFRNAVHAPAS